MAKKVGGYGLALAAEGTIIETDGRQIDISGRLSVPIRNTAGALTSLQIVDEHGGKMFLRGGKVAGGRHFIGGADSPWPLHIAEGYATAATVHEATGHPVAVAFTAYNLAAVAAQHRAANPDRSIFIVADNGREAKRNVRLETATAVAAAMTGPFWCRRFSSPTKWTDWNDAMKARGIEAVRLELTTQLAIGTRRKIAKGIAEARGYGREDEKSRAHNTLELTR